MRRKKNKVGAHCPLCNIPYPHTDEPIVAEMLLLFFDPASLTLRSRDALADLRGSIISDISEQRFFAWQTRLRQIEEIYIKALYCVLFADSAELPHIFSGREPNTILRYYRRVNEEVFEGRGTWEAQPASGAPGALKPLDILHGSAHASYFSIFVAMAYAHQLIPTTYAENLVKHVTTYCDRLKYMHDMFKAGRDKQTITDALRNMHRPLRHWQNRAKS